jgi:hypothetical protein
MLVASDLGVLDGREIVEEGGAHLGAEERVGAQAVDRFAQRLREGLIQRRVESLRADQLNERIGSKMRSF